MNIQKKLLRWRLVRQMIRLLRQGTSPHKLALTLVLGILLGIIPAFGFITPLCTIMALWLRLNLPLALAVLYVMLPLQLALFIPFFRLGEHMFNLPPVPFSPEKLLDMIQNDWWGAMEQIGLANLAAVAAWFILSIPVGYLLYLVLLWVVRRASFTLSVI